MPIYISKCTGSGSGGSGGVDSGLIYTDIVSADYDLNVGECVRVDSSAGSFEINFPELPLDHSKVGVLDVNGSLETNNVFLVSDEKIDNETDDYICDVNFAYLEFVYDESTTNWIAIEVPIPEGETVEIVDNLISTDTDKALSANQGKVLKDLIDSGTGGPDEKGLLLMFSEGNEKHITVTTKDVDGRITNKDVYEDDAKTILLYTQTRSYTDGRLTEKVTRHVESGKTLTETRGTDKKST